MLLGEQGGGDQHRHLLAVARGNERRTHGHLGFPKAHIAAHQAVHDPRRGHVADNRLNCRRLIRGLLKREARCELFVLQRWQLETKALACLAAGVNVQ